MYPHKPSACEINKMYSRTNYTYNKLASKFYLLQMFPVNNLIYGIIDFVQKKCLNFLCLKFKNGQTYFKNLAVFTPAISLKNV